MTTRDNEEPFLARWSRRKRAGGIMREEGAAVAGSTPRPEVPPGDSKAAAQDGPQLEAELPDPDMLDASADFRIFLREGVPEELRIRALRRLWRVNPIISAVCPLVDYGEDYTDAARVVPDLKSVFKTGLELLDRAAQADTREPAAEQGSGGAVVSGSQDRALADARKGEGAV